MSDTPQGPGWWIASDGRWYAPELHPDVREPVTDQSPPPGEGWPSSPPTEESLDESLDQPHDGRTTRDVLAGVTAMVAAKLLKEILARMLTGEPG